MSLKSFVVAEALLARRRCARARRSAAGSRRRCARAACRTGRSGSARRRAAPSLSARRSCGSRRSQRPGTNRSKYGAPPRDRHAEPGRRRRVVGVEPREHDCERRAARRAGRAPDGDPRRQDSWWSGGTSTSIPSECTTRIPSSRCCSGEAPAPPCAPASAGQLVDELVDPAAPTAPAAAPTTSCRRVSFIRRGLMQDERRELLLQVPHDVVERQRRRDVLGERVERAVAPPEQQRMPRVGVLVDRVEPSRDSVRGELPARVGVARDVPAVAAAGAAGRDLRAARVRTQVDVQLTAGGTAAGLLPDEALEVAAVRRDRVDVVPLAADLALERVGQPAGAVDGRLDPVRELLPPGRVGAGRLRLDLRAAAAACLASPQPRRQERAGTAAPARPRGALSRRDGSPNGQTSNGWSPTRWAMCPVADEHGVDAGALEREHLVAGRRRRRARSRACPRARRAAAPARASSGSASSSSSSRGQQEDLRVALLERELELVLVAHVDDGLEMLVRVLVLGAQADRVGVDRLAAADPEQRQRRRLADAVDRPVTASAFAPCASASRAPPASSTQAMTAIPSPSEMRWLRRRDPGTCSDRR